MYSAIILLAGSGSRMNLGYNKMLSKVNGKYLFLYTLEKFRMLEIPLILVVSASDLDIIKPYIKEGEKIVLGGKTRTESVYHGLLSVQTDRVIIHDGARALVSSRILKDAINSKADAFYTAIPLKDTIRNKDTNETINRDLYLSVQTPQGGITKLFLDSYKEGVSYFDDIEPLKNKGINIEIIKGEEKNFKITTKFDLEMFKFVEEKMIRIGYAYDTHRLVQGRKLILGGVLIESNLGLLGHSDADCLLHAIANAFLGSLSLGDLGKHFPDTSKETKDMDSKVILKKCYQMVLDKGYHLNNMDTMIHCESIKMAPYILKMQKEISEILNVDITAISIKATRGEKMGFIGRGEGISCECSLLISND